MKVFLDFSETLIIICIACSLLTMLFYKSRMYSAVRFVCSIIIISYVFYAFIPLYSAIGELIDPSLFESETETDKPDDFDNNHINTVTVGLCTSVKKMISGRYGIHEEDISVSITVNTDDPKNIVFKSVTISITAEHQAFCKDIADYVGDMLGCGCIVLIK